MGSNFLRDLCSRVFRSYRPSFMDGESPTATRQIRNHGWSRKKKKKDVCRTLEEVIELMTNTTDEEAGSEVSSRNWSSKVQSSSSIIKSAEERNIPQDWRKRRFEESKNFVFRKWYTDDKRKSDNRRRRSKKVRMKCKTLRWLENPQGRGIYRETEI